MFLLKKSRKIQLLIGTHVENREKNTQIDVLTKVFNLYRNRGFDIVSLITDIEFNCIRDDINPVELQTVPADDHVGDIEVSIKLVKEDLRCTVQGLPYRRYPKLMIIEMVADVLRKRTQFPANDGISDKLSPLTIVNGDGPPDFNKMKFEFGAYDQAFQSNKKTNTNTTRSVGAIALSMTPNKNGEYKFMSLNTGRLIHRRQFKVLPITEEVIKRVHELAKREDQPLVDKGELSIEWRPGLQVDSTVVEEGVVAVYDQPGTGENQLELSEDEENGDDSSDTSSVQDHDQPILNSDEEESEDDDEEQYEDARTPPQNNETKSVPHDEASITPPDTDDEDAESVSSDENSVTTVDETPKIKLEPTDAATPTTDQEDEGSSSDDESTKGRYNLRKRSKRPEYGFRFASIMNESDHKKSYGAPTKTFKKMHT